MNRTIAAVTFVLLAAAAAPAAAQDSPNAVRPGMTEAEVRAAWGEPLAIRRANDWTYMHYENGMGSIHRYHDVVFLQNGQVVDAIVRMPGRIYTGQSSSPAGRAPVHSPPRGDANPGASTGTVTGVRVTP